MNDEREKDAELAGAILIRLVCEMAADEYDSYDERDRSRPYGAGRLLALAAAYGMICHKL